MTNPPTSDWLGRRAPALDPASAAADDDGRLFTRELTRLQADVAELDAVAQQLANRLFLVLRSAAETTPSESAERLDGVPFSPAAREVAAVALNVRVIGRLVQDLLDRLDL